MKKLPPISKFLSFSTLLTLHFLISLSSSSLPVDFVIKPSTCNLNSDCPYYRYSKCNGSNQCVQCETPADCTQFSEAGEEVECATAITYPSYKYCVVSCSPSNKEPCRKMRGHCQGGRCKQCSTDTQCRGESYPGTAADLWCDDTSVPGLEICSSCPENGCPGTSVCQNFKCVYCSSNDDCGTSAPYCEKKFERNNCRACFEHNHCPAAFSKCSGYNCVRCSGDEFCVHITGKPKCTTTKGCVECFNHDHCTGSNDYCSATNQCVECTENGHCTSGHCVGNICVQCELDTHCTNPLNPKCTANTCGPCSNPTTVCSDNFSGKPICSSSGACVQCENHSDCPNPSQPECSSSSKTCQPCSGPTFCSGLGINLNQCATTGPNTGKCVQCISDGNCSGSLGQCLETTTNTCVECIDHGDCTDPQKPQCSGNTCQPCPDSPFCLGLPGPLDKCALTGPNIGSCVQCISAGDCSGTTLVCSATLNTCVQCTDHTDCQDPKKPRCSGNTCQPCSDSTFCSNLGISLNQCALSGPNIGKCVECTDPIQCTSGSLNHCSNTLNTCVECFINSDCLDPMKPVCSGNICLPCSSSVFCSYFFSATGQCAFTGPNTGKCVECTDNTHCSGTTSICSLTSNTCVQCTDSIHCTDPSAPRCSANTCQACPNSPFCAGKYPGDLPYCESGACVECTAPEHCPGSSCSASNTCVECTISSECPTSQLPLCLSSTCQSCSTSPGICATRFSTTKPICLSTNGECVECETSGHCTSSSKPQCKLAGHTCVECTAHSHCLDSTKPFCGPSHTCQPCPDSTFCSNLPTTPDQCALTGPNTGKCVECTGGTHCSLTTPVCSLTSNTCVKFTNSNHCTNPSAPFCDSANTCQPCPDSSFCVGKYPGDLPFCVTGTCVECIALADCSVPTAYCSSAKTCVECTSHSHCPTLLPSCSSNTCQSCSSSSGVCATRFPTTKPVCLSTNGQCAECETSSHCTYSSSKPRCELSSHTCVECTGHSHCLDPTKPRCSGNTCQPCSGSTFCGSSSQCATSGPNTGKCVQCTGNGHCPPATPVCSLTSNTCVGCTDSAHCTNPSAPFCGSGNTCQACPDHTFCNTKYPGDLPYCVAGACVECSAPGHCGAPTPYCSLVNTCVECTGDSLCPSPSLAKCWAYICQPCTAFHNICSKRFPDKPICSSGECVECETSSHCTSSSSKPQCRSASKTCVECLDYSHCLDSAKPFCGASNTCQSCSSASITFCSTKYSGALPYCETTTGACVECLQSADCLDSSKPNCISNICQSTIYQPQCSPNYNIQIKQIPTRLNHFDLHFPSDLASKIDIESTLTLSLISIPKSDYTYILTKLTSTHYQAIFTSQITISPTKLRLQLPCPAQPGFIFGDILIETPIQSIPLIDPELEETIETIESITTVTANVMAGASGSMILAGANPALMWALIGLLQAFYYMIFINVQYPVNVQAFFRLFSMGNLSFIPNPIEWFFPEIDNVDLQAPSKFLENDVDGLFLQTAGNMLLTWFLVLVGFLVSKFILKFTRNMPRLLNRAAFKMVQMFEWSGVIRTFMTSYTQLSLAALLQIRVLNFDRQLYGVSSLSGIAFTLFAFVFPPVLVLLIHKFSKYPKILNTTFSTLTDEFKYDKQKLAPIYFNAFFVIRRLVLVLALIFLHDYPYLEVVILILNCLIWLFLLLKYFPYEKKINNIVNIISEFLFVVIHVIILLFAHDDHKDWLTDQKKLDLGWIIISCCGVILVLTLIVACIEQYFVVKDLIQLLKTFLKERKTSSRGIKRKSSPQIRSTQNTMLNSQNTSTDDLNNSMTLMPFVPLQNITQHRRRIVRPPRKTTGTSTSPSSMIQENNRSEVTYHNNQRQIIHNHIRDIIMAGKKKGSKTHNLHKKM